MQLLQPCAANLQIPKGCIIVLKEVFEERLEDWIGLFQLSHEIFQRMFFALFSQIRHLLHFLPAALICADQLKWYNNTYSKVITNHFLDSVCLFCNALTESTHLSQYLNINFFHTMRFHTLYEVVSHDVAVRHSTTLFAGLATSLCRLSSSLHLRNVSSSISYMSTRTAFPNVIDNDVYEIFAYYGIAQDWQVCTAVKSALCTLNTTCGIFRLSVQRRQKTEIDYAYQFSVGLCPFQSEYYRCK